jgi:hypothetical protein
MEGGGSVWQETLAGLPFILIQGEERIADRQNLAFAVAA